MPTMMELIEENKQLKAKLEEVENWTEKGFVVIYKEKLDELKTMNEALISQALEARRIVEKHNNIIKNSLRAAKSLGFTHEQILELHEASENVAAALWIETVKEAEKLRELQPRYDAIIKMVMTEYHDYKVDRIFERILAIADGKPIKQIIENDWDLEGLR